MKSLNNLLDWAFGIAIMSLLLSCNEVDYASENARVLKSIFKYDFKDYYFRGTPVGNFGVGTMYLNEPGVPIENQWLVGHPDTWFVEGISDNEKQQLMKNIIVPGDLAKKIGLHQQITKGTNINAVAPLLVNILGLEANIETTKNVEVTLYAENIINRKMNLSEFNKAINDGKIKDAVAKVIKGRNISICSHDIIYEGFKVTINATKNATLSTALETKVNEPVIGEGGKLQVKVSRTTTGTFIVESVNPVVAAVLYKKPPPTMFYTYGDTGAAESLDLWRISKIDKELKSLGKKMNP